MFWLMLLWGCGETPVTTHPEANLRTAKAACKLFVGAGETCTSEGATFTALGKKMSVDVAYTEAYQATGSVNFKALVTWSSGDERWSMPMRGYGMNPIEALDLGIHEWAVVSGVAVVDKLMDKPGLPALAAVDKGELTPISVEGRRVWRGWTRGGTKAPLDHQMLASGLATLRAVPMSSVVSFVVTRLATGETSVTAYVDGRPSPEVAQWIKDQPFKQTGAFEVRQTYLFE